MEVFNGTNMSEAVVTEEYVLSYFQSNNFVVIWMYVPVFLFALVANALVVMVVVKDKSMRSVTNYFLVNLAVSDLLVTMVGMPAAVWRAYTMIFPFGNFTCKFIGYMQCISVASSIFTLTMMAVDRYLAIIRPFGLSYRCLNTKSASIAILSIWLNSFLIFSPIWWIPRLHVEVLTFGSQNISISLCIEDYENLPVPRHILGLFWFVIMFAIPGIVMLSVYSMMGRTLCYVMPPIDNNEASCVLQRNKVLKSRRRVACILLLLAFVFAACWLPYHIIILIFDMVGANPSFSSGNSVNMYLLLLGHANSALNPVIYCALSQKFLRSIRVLLHMVIPCLRSGAQPFSDLSAMPLNTYRCNKSPSVVENAVRQIGHNTLQSSQKTTRTCAV